MALNVRFEGVSASRVNALLSGPDSGVARDMLRRALRVETEAKRRCPVNHGRLRASITHQLVHTSTLGASAYGVQVGTNVSYALFVHNGTGIYGPRRAPITPTSSSVLKFTVGGTTVYVKSVKGQPAHPFLKEALSAARG